MRPLSIFLAVSLSVAACSRDLTSSSSPTSGTPTPSNGLNIAVDSALANQTAVVGTAIVAKVHVTQSGQPVSGIAVNWIPATDGGTVSPTSSTTDAGGVATTIWTLGDTARAYTLTAAMSAASVGLQATAIAGPAASLSKTGADSVIIAAGASTLLTVRATDKRGNSVGGVTVVWTTTGGSLTASSTTTGASGKAEVVFSSGPVPQTYTVTATAAGLGTQTFAVLVR